MLKYSLNQIKKSKLYLNPFPYFVVKNLIPKKNLRKLNSILPSFEDITEKKYTSRAPLGQKKLYYLNLLDIKN